MDFGFLGGSMGSVVGEKFAMAADLAVAHGVPFVSVAASGGARMQENILALMQMAKTVMAVDAVRDARLPFISICAHPTTGGVIASFAALGDIAIAEPGALMSFAGPRVVQQTTRETLPEDFGLAESQLRLGHVDAVVPRGELTATLAPPAGAVRAAAGGDRRRGRGARAAGRRARSAGCADCVGRGSRWLGSPRSIRRLRRRFQERGEESQIWDVVQNARHQDRPYSLDYAKRLFGDSYELHGDRTAGDDPAIVAGIATYHGRPVAFVGHQKGRDLAERTHRNFGMARPEGYRKAIRAIELADRLGYPILTFVDTPGAYPGRRRRAGAARRA